jgi:hypothetical protein
MALPFFAIRAAVAMKSSHGAPRLTDQDRHLFHVLRAAALLLLAQLPCVAASYAGQPAWLDARVSQETIASTICHRGYLAQVMQSIDDRIRLRARPLSVTDMS